jgi:hypothetical protein
MERAKFRFHKGPLSDSMKTVMEVDSLDDIREKMYWGSSGRLTCSFMMFDPRINWKTYVICDGHGTVGFSNRLLKYKGWVC